MTDLDTLVTDLRAKAEAAKEREPNSFANFLNDDTFDDVLALCDALTEARGEVEALKNLQKWREEDEAELATLRAEVQSRRAEIAALREARAKPKSVCPVCRGIGRIPIVADQSSHSVSIGMVPCPEGCLGPILMNAPPSPESEI